MEESRQYVDWLEEKSMFLIKTKKFKREYSRGEDGELTDNSNDNRYKQFEFRPDYRVPHPDSWLFQQNPRPSGWFEYGNEAKFDWTLDWDK